MRNLIRDFQHGFRLLLRNPGFSISALIVLALGIGANTAIFSVVNAVLLRPLPYQDSSRIMQIWHVPPIKSFPGMTTFAVSPANYLDWKAQSSSFEATSAYGFVGFNFGGKDRPEAIKGASVAPEFFSILRVHPLLGRSFSPQEDGPGAGRVVVLGHDLWRDRFGSDPDIVGRNITLNDESYNVIGVMPEKFKFPDWAQVWVPLAWNNAKRAVRGNHNYLVVARLKPDVTLSEAQAELTTISSRLERQYPADDAGWGATIRPLREEMVHEIRPALLVLLGAVAFVILIACANVANLVLAKTLARGKEIAVRSALGASRADVVRHILAETLLLSCAGGVLGLLLAKLAVTLIANFLGPKLPRFTEINLDAQVLAFTLLLALFTGLLSGILPALRLTRTDVNEALKQGTRGGSEGGGNRTRSILVVSEVALSLMLLIGAGLMIRSLWMLRSVHPGFDSHGVLTASVDLPATRYPSDPKLDAFCGEMLARVRALPGVVSAGLVTNLPANGGGSHQPFSIEGQPVLPMAEQPEVAVREISAGYLSTMRIPILEGRELHDADIVGRTPVVLISKSMAQMFWPGRNPIGTHITLTFFPESPMEIVGIVGDVKQDGLDQVNPSPTIYNSIRQRQTPSFALAVRTVGRPEDLATSVVAAVHSVDPQQPVVDVLSMDTLLEQSLASQRFGMTLLAAFALLALVLASVGIYSVLAYAVRRRVREIGIRIALGATQSDVLRLILFDGMKPTLLGIAIGLAGAMTLGKVLSNLIYGVKTTDVVTFCLVVSLLVVVGLLASLAPAYRAAQIEPVCALREE